MRASELIQVSQGTSTAPLAHVKNVREGQCVQFGCDSWEVQTTIPRIVFPTDGRGRLIGGTMGGMNAKLHAICDSKGRPLNFFVSVGQVSEITWGARLLFSSQPDVAWELWDRGYDADWFREALQDKGIRPCINGRKQRKATVSRYDKRRNRIEIMFGRLKEWSRVATRYDKCPTIFLFAIALAAVIIYWL